MAIWLTIGTLVAGLSLRPVTSQDKSGIPECDKYEAIVTACLPKMCMAERAVAELDLELHRQILPTLLQLKGRPAAVQACVEKIDEAIQEDEFGCYSSLSGNKGRPGPAIRVDKVRPTDTGVVMTLRDPGPASNSTKVTIVTVPGEPVTAVYQLPEWKGQFVLDTTSASPTLKAGPGKPVTLDPETPYCFVIQSSNGTGKEIYRKGTFTTLPKR